MSQFRLEDVSPPTLGCEVTRISHSVRRPNRSSSSGDLRANKVSLSESRHQLSELKTRITKTTAAIMTLTGLWSCVLRAERNITHTPLVLSPLRYKRSPRKQDNSPTHLSPLHDSNPCWSWVLNPIYFKIPSADNTHHIWRLFIFNSPLIIYLKAATSNL